MSDPSNGVPPALLPHVHLLSNFKFPLNAHLGIDTVVEYLLQAPNITRSAAPMTWQFIDAPANGSILLAWQPPQLGSQCASDGYVWGDPESAYSLDHNGYTVEMFVHRFGYHPATESVASHARRRYRLVSSQGAHFDASLFLIHYSPAEPRRQIPANRISIIPPQQQMLNTRRYLQSQGQLVRKEFMLHDRANWPTVNLPSAQGASIPPQAGYQYQGGAMPPAGRGAAYYGSQGQMPQGAAGPSPAKRPRHTPPNHMPGAPSVPGMHPMPEMSIEEEEDTSRGDMLDHLTPREISLMRYRQHHEWMEEILSSPYSIGQIVSVDLGLGMKGELEPFTQGFFNAPSGDIHLKEETPARMGRMEPSKADEFRRRASQKLAEMNKDIEKMKTQQAKRMAKLKKGTQVKEGELRLRSAVHDPDSTGPEVWRIEGRIDPDQDSDEPELENGEIKRPEKVEDIVNEISTGLGRKVEATPSMVCIQKGGIEEKEQLDEAADHGAGEADNQFKQPDANGVDGAMENDASNTLFDDLGFSTNSTPGHQFSQVPTPSGQDNFGGAPQAGAAPPQAQAPTPDVQSAPQAPRQPSQPAVAQPPPETQQDAVPSETDFTADIEMGDDVPGVPEAEGILEQHDSAQEQVDMASPAPAVQPEQPSEQSVGAQSNGGTPSAFLNTPGSGIQGLTPSDTGNEDLLAPEASPPAPTPALASAQGASPKPDAPAVGQSEPEPPAAPAQTQAESQDLPPDQRAPPAEPAELEKSAPPEHPPANQENSAKELDIGQLSDLGNLQAENFEAGEDGENHDFQLDDSAFASALGDDPMNEGEG